MSVKCYGSAADGCPRRGTCALYVKPPMLVYPCRDYREHWTEEEQTSEVCSSYEAQP